MPLKSCLFCFSKKEEGKMLLKEKESEGNVSSKLTHLYNLLLHVLCRDTSGKNRENLVSLNEKRSSSFATLFHWISSFCRVYRLQREGSSWSRRKNSSQKSQEKKCSSQQKTRTWNMLSMLMHFLSCWSLLFHVCEWICEKVWYLKGKKHEVAQLHFIPWNKKEEKMRKKRREDA